MWWENAVIYEIYVRSFADGNGDGVGDLPGVIAHLDYLAWLGVDAIWLTPIMRSPGVDNGYDVCDYRAVDPLLGTMGDVDRLVEAAGRRGIKVLLDLVPNHTSDQHPWFRDSRLRERYYVWSDRPNNWIGTFQQPMWTRDPAGTGRYYLHSYLPEQPDLNWWDDDVRAEFDDILRFWFDRGIAGFRIDACYIIVKDRHLRDNPPAGVSDHLWDRNRGQCPVWNAHQPQVHDVLRRWRAIAAEYRPERLLMGATWVPDVAELSRYYGTGDELQLPQYFQLLFCDFTPAALCAAVEAWLAAVPPGQVPVWAASSHDLPRFPSRWCDGDPALIRTAQTLLLSLPGACILYQGDELGLQDGVVPDELARDRTQPGRDPYRTPMPWDGGTHGGFSRARPWLPVSDVSVNVADQQGRADSLLNHTRRLIALKKRTTGGYRRLALTEDRWAYRRGDRDIVLEFTPAMAEARR
jgi:alpha-glucosidase